jgi:uncharacterized membrane protein YheB (UPF0754 family)
MKPNTLTKDTPMTQTATNIDQAPPLKLQRRSLYEITSDLMALEDLLLEVGGDVSEDAAQQAIDQWLESLGEERDKKLNGYCWLIREMESRAETRKAEAARLSALAQSDLNAAKRLKDRMKMFMELTGAAKIETEHFKIGVQDNGGKRAVELMPEFAANPESLPEQFQRWTVAPDIDLIRQEMETGSQLPFATLAPRGTHVRIR